VRALFDRPDLLRLHLGNRLGRWFPDREKRSMGAGPLPSVPLLYHAVGETGGEGQVSTLAEILEHVGYLRRSDPEGLRRLVTFDDGYATSIPAIRRLCRMGQPVIWFVTTWCRDGEYLPKDWLRIVAERLEPGRTLSIGSFSIRLHNRFPAFRRWLAFRINRALMLSLSRREYLQAYERFHGRYRSLIEAEIHDHLALASPAGIRALCAEFPALVIGCHGRAHYRWDRITDPCEFHEEAVGSRQELEEISGRVVDTVAYPYGYRPRNACMDVIRREYRSGFLAKALMGDDLYLQPRVAMDGVMPHGGEKVGQ